MADFLRWWQVIGLFTAITLGCACGDDDVSPAPLDTEGEADGTERDAALPDGIVADVVESDEGHDDIGPDIDDVADLTVDINLDAENEGVFPPAPDGTCLEGENGAVGHVQFVDGTPLVSATVAVKTGDIHHLGYTDEAGRFFIQAPCEALYVELAVYETEDHPSYPDIWHLPLGTFDAAIEERVFQIPLIPIDGFVFDIVGDPIVGAQLEAELDDPPVRVSNLDLADEAGRFTVWVVPWSDGLYSFTARGPEDSDKRYRTATITTLVEEPLPEPLEFTLYEDRCPIYGDFHTSEDVSLDWLFIRLTGATYPDGAEDYMSFTTSVYYPSGEPQEIYNNVPTWCGGPQTLRLWDAGWNAPDWPCIDIEHPERICLWRYPVLNTESLAEPMDDGATIEVVRIGGVVTDTFGIAQAEVEVTASATYPFHYDEDGWTYFSVYNEAETDLEGSWSMVVIGFEGPEDCFNEIDDDIDGLADCLDSDCMDGDRCLFEPSDEETEETVEICNNGIDDDLDWYADCDDFDCRRSQYCYEICDNGIDDNGFGDIDCDDWRCSWARECWEYTVTARIPDDDRRPLDPTDTSVFIEEPGSVELILPEGLPRCIVAGPLRSSEGREFSQVTFEFAGNMCPEDTECPDGTDCEAAELCAIESRPTCDDYYCADGESLYTPSSWRFYTPEPVRFWRVGEEDEEIPFLPLLCGEHYMRFTSEDRETWGTPACMLSPEEVCFTAWTWWWWDHVVTAPMDGIEIPVVHLSGHVHDHLGAPVQSAGVQAMNPQGMFSFALNMNTTDGSGFYDFVVIPDRTWNVSVSGIYNEETNLTGSDLCFNGWDDDGDGFTDCEDQDCQGELFSCYENCDNGLDDDGDGLIDCMDPLCASSCGGCDRAEVCTDFFNNDEDCDGFRGCEDSDCDSLNGCWQTLYIEESASLDMHMGPGYNRCPFSGVFETSEGVELERLQLIIEGDAVDLTLAGDDVRLMSGYYGMGWDYRSVEPGLYYPAGSSAEDEEIPLICSFQKDRDGVTQYIGPQRLTLYSWRSSYWPNCTDPERFDQPCFYGYTIWSELDLAVPWTGDIVFDVVWIRGQATEDGEIPIESAVVEVEGTVWDQIGTDPDTGEPILSTRGSVSNFALTRPDGRYSVAVVPAPNSSYTVTITTPLGVDLGTASVTLDNVIADETVDVDFSAVE